MQVEGGPRRTGGVRVAQPADLHPRDAGAAADGPDSEGLGLLGRGPGLEDVVEDPRLAVGESSFI